MIGSACSSPRELERIGLREGISSFSLRLLLAPPASFLLFDPLASFLLLYSAFTGVDFLLCTSMGLRVTSMLLRGGAVLARREGVCRSTKRLAKSSLYALRVKSTERITITVLLIPRVSTCSSLFTPSYAFSLPTFARIMSLQ